MQPNHQLATALNVEAQLSAGLGDTVGHVAGAVFVSESKVTFEGQRQRHDVADRG